VSDEDATGMLSTCPQQVVRVVLVDFGQGRRRKGGAQAPTLKLAIPEICY